VRIRLQDIELQANHGVFDYEREAGNTFRVSVSMQLPDTEGMTTDRLEDTLDYGALCAVVEREMRQPSNLLEHVAARIRKALAAEWPEASDIRVSVSKKNPPVGLPTAWATVEL
jgi:dihydroneopterin aldolase